MVSPVRRPPECSYKYDGVLCEGRLVFSRMPEAPGAASGGAQRLAFLKLHLQGGLENELRDAVSSSGRRSSPDVLRRTTVISPR